MYTKSRIIISDFQSYSNTKAMSQPSQIPQTLALESEAILDK